MPVINGRVCIEVTCSCGHNAPLHSGTYGIYCPACGKPIRACDYLVPLMQEIRKAIKEERKNIRKSKKDHTFVKEDVSVGSSPFLSTCKICNGALTPENLYIIDEEAICSNCQSKLPKCKGCGERHLPKYLEGGACQGCKESFEICPTCHTMFDNRKTSTFEVEGRIYCDACVANYLNAKGILLHTYSYKPRPYFFGEKQDGYFYGVELEIDNSNRRGELMARSGVEEVYFKTDGSLGIGGVEIVSHPATLKYHMNEFPWDRVLDCAKAAGYRSHTASGITTGRPTCGLHIHVSKTAFGRNNDERDSREAKLLILFDKFWPQLVIFSRRDKASLERWARKYADFDVSKEDLKHIIDKAKSANSGDRHLAVNMSGTAASQPTIEFRLFRGTLNKETLLASIQLVDLLVESTRLPTKKIQTLTWEDFVEGGCAKYEEFARYIRRLRDGKKKI